MSLFRTASSGSGSAPQPAPLISHTFVSEKSVLGFAWTGGVLIFVAVSGLAVWLLPFSIPSQVAVLMHTLLGLALVVPLTLWQLSHWLASRKAPRCFRKICAYAGVWTMSATTISGLVLTWQAAFSLATSHFWDQAHLWTGLVAVPFLAYHAYPHARRAARNSKAAGTAAATPDVRPARRRLWTGASWGAGALIGAAILLAAVYRFYAPDFSHYALPAAYKLPYGSNPFTPSMAKTGSGRPVAPQLLAGSNTCGEAGCHAAIFHEWAADAHRWSSEDKFFQAVQGAMMQQEGAPATRYCAGCHDPVSLLSAYKNASTSIEAPGFKEGSSCVVCHATRRVDVQGNGNYVWSPPRPYLFEYRGSAYARAITHFLIRAYPQQHDLDYDLALDRQPASCGACHKQFIDKQINHVGWVQLQNQYDDWKHGKWDADPNPARRLRCQDCHMYYQAGASMAEADPYDVKHGLGLRHRSHWFAAANQVMPELIDSPDAADQTRRATEWIQGKKYIPEIAGVWPAGPVIPVKIVASEPFLPGASTAFRVVLTNNKAGHSFPTGPLDLIRAWVEVTVSDASEKVLFHSGELTADDHVEPGTFVLKAEGVNSSGQEIVRHDLWHYVGAQWKRAIFPGYSDMYEYRLRLPLTAKGPLTISARLRYRKANQYFMDFAFPGQHLSTPITDLSGDRVEVPLADLHGALAEHRGASRHNASAASPRRAGSGR
ncbi:MAG TPA: hypothetical protein VGZ29_16765 [Terriglobia bacterium]|nr:hypothetical protein [Terriglobia bacterium]